MKNIFRMISVCMSMFLLFSGFLNFKTEKNTSQIETKSVELSFPEMMTRLSRNMSLWPELSPSERKQAVEAVIAIYKTKDNIAILNTPDFYVNRIEETMAENQSVSGMSIMNMMRILAIMEYDFYNGQNKDELARQTLGEKVFSANKVRLQYKR